jgi:hypothetical protein
MLFEWGWNTSVEIDFSLHFINLRQVLRLFCFIIAQIWGCYDGPDRSVLGGPRLRVDSTYAFQEIQIPI